MKTIVILSAFLQSFSITFSILSKGLAFEVLQDFRESNLFLEEILNSILADTPILFFSLTSMTSVEIA